MNTEPLRTSSDPNARLLLEITPNTPVCDMRYGTPGRVVGVTNGYCIFRVGLEEADDSYSVTAWKDIAIGNVGPSPKQLPDDSEERDRLDTCAVLFRELSAAHPKHLLSSLNEAAQELLDILTATLEKGGE